MKSIIYALALAALLSGAAAAAPMALTRGDVAALRFSTPARIQVIVGTTSWCPACKIYAPIFKSVTEAFTGAPVDFYVYDTDLLQLAGMPNYIPHTWVRTENAACGGIVDGAAPFGTVAAAIIGALGCQFGGQR